MEFNDRSSQMVTRKAENGVCPSLSDGRHEGNRISNEICANGRDIRENQVENPSGSSCVNYIMNGVNGNPNRNENKMELQSNLTVRGLDSTMYKSLVNATSCSQDSDKKFLPNKNHFTKEETYSCKSTIKKLCLTNGIRDESDSNFYHFNNASSAFVENVNLNYNDSECDGAAGCSYAEQIQITESGSSINDVSPEMDFLEFDYEEQNVSGDDPLSENSNESRTQSPQLENDVYLTSVKNDLGEPSGLQKNSFVHDLTYQNLFENLESNVKFRNNCLQVIPNSNDGQRNGDDNCSDNTDSDSANMELCNERFLARESHLFNIQSEEMVWDDYNVQSALLYSYNSICVENKCTPDYSIHSCLAEVKKRREENEEEENVEKTMIWSEMDACSRQVTQIGTSACGATAVINVLMALNRTYDKKLVESYVSTRYRAESAPIAKYLRSRSKAGTTHEELIKGVHKVTKGEVFGRFFAMHPARNFQVLSWLGFWIKKGAIPIATLNLQCGILNGQSIPDSWHHQMVFGVGPKGVYLTNPLECIPGSQFEQQTSSESVLLIRRSDVISRWDNDCDLSPLVTEGPHWRELNVLGQVINVLRESTSAWVPGHRRYLMSHVKIPAAYKSGVTLFVCKDSEAYDELVSCPELTLVKNI